MSADMRADMSADMRADMGLRAEMRADMVFDVRADMRADVRADMRADMSADMRADMRADMTADVAHQKERRFFGAKRNIFGAFDVHQNIDTKEAPKKHQSTPKTKFGALWCENTGFFDAEPPQ